MVTKFLTKEILILKETGSSAKGHSDNIEFFQILDIKHLITLFYLLLRGDSHKYSQENLTYRLNITKLTKNFDIGLSESTEFQDILICLCYMVPI